MKNLFDQLASISVDPTETKEDTKNDKRSSIVDTNEEKEKKEEKRNSVIGEKDMYPLLTAIYDFTSRTQLELSITVGDEVFIIILYMSIFTFIHLCLLSPLH